MSRILVTGGSGMVGQALQKLWLPRLDDVVYLSSSSGDLRNRAHVASLFEIHEPEIVVHLAAKVGGVKGNTEFVADYTLDNTLINMNVLDACRRTGVRKVVSMLSSCIYPDRVEYPITEDQLHNGEPHPSNFGYAYAKRMSEVYGRALWQQYGLNCVFLVPTNLYGNHDNFDLENGHFLPAVIRKVHAALVNNDPSVTFWGDGSPLRQFTLADDLALVIGWAIEHYDSPAPLNVGNPQEDTIKGIIEMTCNQFGYSGQIVWDTSKPAGQHRKPVSIEALRKAGYAAPFTPTKQGIAQVCSWYMENFPKVRL